MKHFCNWSLWGDKVSCQAQAFLIFTEGFTKYRDIDDTGECVGPVQY